MSKPVFWEKIKKKNISVLLSAEKYIQSAIKHKLLIIHDLKFEQDHIYYPLMTGPRSLVDKRVDS